MAHGAPRRDVPSLAPRAMAQYGARLEEHLQTPLLSSSPSYSTSSYPRSSSSKSSYNSSSSSTNLIAGADDCFWFELAIPFPLSVVDELAPFAPTPLVE
ncbi:hypothetical protein YC2023_019917 [Brassica napus]